MVQFPRLQESMVVLSHGPLRDIPREDTREPLHAHSDEEAGILREHQPRLRRSDKQLQPAALRRGWSMARRRYDKGIQGATRTGLRCQRGGVGQGRQARRRSLRCEHRSGFLWREHVLARAVGFETGADRVGTHHEGQWRQAHRLPV